MYDWKAGGFGLYLHWPFCQSKCPYCDFNSHIAGKIDAAEWLNGYKVAIKGYSEAHPGRVLQTIYFGGGTPSLMPADLVEGIISEIRKSWQTVNDLEITLEANPTSVEADRLELFRQAGVNRISMGIQALDDKALRALGRLHSKREALAALETARNIFDRVSFDLIYARQNQSLADWRRELREATEFAADHLSLYQLTIEDGTAFADRAARGGLLGLPTEDLAADMYDLTQEICDLAGLPAYEVSNHAKPGAESRHNMIYWRCGDYIGIGPGAHGRTSSEAGRQATEAARDPAAWLKAVQANGLGESSKVQLTDSDCALEYLLMSLRTNEGLDLRRYRDIAGQQLTETALLRLEDLRLVERAGGRLRTTHSGRLVLNSVLRDLAVE